MKQWWMAGAVLSLGVLAYGSAQSGTLKVAHYFDPLGGSNLEQSLAWLEGVSDTFKEQDPAMGGA